MSTTTLSVKETVSADAYAELKNKIYARRARLGVVGLGHTGLPLALSLNEAGFEVTGFDIDSRRVDALQAGQSYLSDITNDALAAAGKNRFRATTNLNDIAGLDAISICVPTPLRKTREPDLSYIVAAVDGIAQALRPGQLIVLESTASPGTTEEVVLPSLAARRLKVGHDFFLAFSPERVDPGNDRFKAKDIPKVVGGVTPKCTELAAMLYGAAMKDVVMVSSARTAEMVKLLENTFRSVNIALVNEVAMMCSRLRLDVWEVIDAAASKPFGFMPFFPGPGLGGHSLPVDPLYLEWKSRIDACESQMISAADAINQGMPGFVTTRVMQLLNDRGKAARGSHIHVFGVTYKKDVGDCRESPAVEVIRSLARIGAKVTYSDPFVRCLTIDGKRLETVTRQPEAWRECDLALIATDHSAFDYLEIVRIAPLVFDLRNATRGLNSKNLVRL